MKKFLLISLLVLQQSVYSQTVSEINSLIESFRLGIITLDSENEWSELFLHDSITWAMIREGKTELRQNFNDPHFSFFSSDPISFFRFLKGKGQKFEERFYEVKITNSDLYGTVEFLYSFHENGKLRNWGKEYWTLVKVKNEWKIGSVIWTENLEQIEPCPFSGMKSFALNRFKCPPCPFGCDNHLYDQPGACPVCHMPLQKVEESVFDGYTKTKLIIPGEGVELMAAYYLPKDIDNLVGAVVISHGSGQSSHEDVSFFTNLAVKLRMAVLAYDKRGAGLSTGKYESFTVERSEEWFKLLSMDLQHCYNWLRALPELENKKIGFLGGSQAGWIMPLAASNLEGVDFIIAGEGAAVSAGEESYFSQLTGDGTGTAQMTLKEADIALQNWKGLKGFDPRTILQNLQVPTLWIFGTNDPVIPVEASIRVLDEIANPKFDRLILNHGDHNFINTQSGKRYELSEKLKKWLSKVL